MAEKKKTKSGKKSSPKKNKAKKSNVKLYKVSGQRSKPAGGNNRSWRNFNPFSLFIILMLIAVIVLLVHKIYFKDDDGGRRNSSTASKEIVKNRESRQSENDTKKNNKIGDDISDGQEDSAELEARIYFVKLNEKTEDMNLLAVRRKISGNNKLEGALKELIKGLSKKERDSGLLNAVPQDLKIRSIKINNRVATIDFNSSIEKGAAGNILISRLDQIVYTATQFEDIESIVITINGKKRNTLGGDGLSISGPLHRRR